MCKKFSIAYLLQYKCKQCPMNTKFAIMLMKSRNPSTLMAMKSGSLKIAVMSLPSPRSSVAEGARLDAAIRRLDAAVRRLVVVVGLEPDFVVESPSRIVLETRLLVVVESGPGIVVDSRPIVALGTRPDVVVGSGLVVTIGSQSGIVVRLRSGVALESRQVVAAGSTPGVVVRS